MRLEFNSWLNYLDDVVNIIPHKDWLSFTHSSGGRFYSRDYPLYAEFFLPEETGGIFFLRKTGGTNLGFFIEKTGSTLLVRSIE